MKTKLLYENSFAPKSSDKGWGFSCLIGNEILFDTGDNYKFLLKNMYCLHIDKNKIKTVILSHDHTDHTGGLWDFLKNRNNIDNIYICKGFSNKTINRINSLSKHLHILDDFTEIIPNLFSTGPIIGKYKEKIIAEQSIVLKEDNQIKIISGCAHPGIDNVVKNIKVRFPNSEITEVLGGFHLKDSSESKIRAIRERCKQMGVKKMSPYHCSGSKCKEVFNTMVNNF